MLAVKGDLYRFDIAGTDPKACGAAIDSLVFFSGLKEVALENWEICYEDVPRIQRLSGLRSLEVGSVEFFSQNGRLADRNNYELWKASKYLGAREQRVAEGGGDVYAEFWTHWPRLPLAFTCWPSPPPLPFPPPLPPSPS